MIDIFNFLFDIERDGYFLPNGTRLNQLDNFDEQRKMTGCSWPEFFIKMYQIGRASCRERVYLCV